MSKKNYDYKHLTTTQRIKIEKGLLDGESFASIARKVDKHPSTIAKEVKKYRYFPERENPSKKLPCIRKSNCAIHFLCDKKDCIRLCKLCYLPSREAPCMELCPDYIAKVCPRIEKAPYVCNNCPKFKRCDLQHALYSSQKADEASHELLISCRDGINQSPADIAILDDLISPLLKHG